MGRTITQMLESLPPRRRQAVKKRTAELMLEVEGLHALRLLAERSQRDIAAKLGVRQPTVHRMERQTDLYLSSLRRYVEAAGGTLELRVNLPRTGTVSLTGIGELAQHAGRTRAAKPAG